MRPVETPVGTLLAVEDGAVVRASGIPYARAERFRYPHSVRLADFGDPFVADSPAPAAPQFLRGKDGDIRQSVLMSEECQNLSIVFPADIAPSEKLPVMVYFHGGLYVVGSGDGARYNPVRLVADEQVVVVMVTYRLGLLGFLGGSKERPANLGLLYGHYPLPNVEQVEDAWKKIAQRVDVLIGTNMRESAYFVPQPPKYLGKMARKVAEFLVEKGSCEMYIEPARRFVRRHRAAGGNATSYVLRVGHPLNYHYSAHCTELALLFENSCWDGDKLLAGSYPNERAEQGRALRAIWAEFARSGVVHSELSERARIEFA